MAYYSAICLVVLLLGVWAHATPRARDATKRFPDDFLIGTATAAYQVEGGWNADGKGESIWDHMFHEHPDFSDDGSTGDVAADSYHHYKEDVQLLSEIGVNHYRFSISWSRILPTGEANNINQAGIDYYNNLINALLANGIQPMVTMYHWDLPQWLQDLGGWANPIIADYFEDYARVLYENFGDRVKWWITINEPLSYISGYTTSRGLAPSVNAPGVGDYLATHTLLIAHAKAYHLYDNEYRSKQQGKVAITLNIAWQEPLTNSTEDIAAADRARQFDLGIFAHPIYSKEGDYPAIVRELVDKNSKAEGRTRSRLPVFSKEMVEYIRGTYDFFGLNFYSAQLATFDADIGTIPSRLHDAGVHLSVDPSWPSGASAWLKVAPWGLRKILNWINDNYNAPTIIITENGFDDTTGALDDDYRSNYIKLHLEEILKSIDDGVKVGGYTYWSLIDNLEWNSGVSLKFGLAYVNYTDPARPRTLKSSAQFLKKVIQTREIPE